MRHTEPRLLFNCSITGVAIDNMHQYCWFPRERTFMSSSVCRGPGQRLLNRMFSRACTTANSRVSARTAPLLAVYATYRETGYTVWTKENCEDGTFSRIWSCWVSAIILDAAYLYGKLIIQYTSLRCQFTQYMAVESPTPAWIQKSRSCMRNKPVCFAEVCCWTENVQPPTITISSRR